MGKFVIKQEWLDAVESAPAEFRCELSFAVLMYASKGELPEISDVAAAIFAPIKSSIDKANALSKVRKDAGRKGGISSLSKKNEEEFCSSKNEICSSKNEFCSSKNGFCSSKTPICSSKTEFCSSKNNTEREKGVLSPDVSSVSPIPPLSPSFPPIIPQKGEGMARACTCACEEEASGELFDSWPQIYERLLTAWNSKCTRLAKIQHLSDSRKKNIRNRLKEIAKAHPGEDPVEVLIRIFEKANASDFCAGLTSAWKADFDWIYGNDRHKVANWLKLEEGRYDNRPGSQFSRTPASVIMPATDVNSAWKDFELPELKVIEE